MKLFTVGPVQMFPETLQIEGTQLPYFRTPAFSEIMKDVEKWFLESIHAPEESFFIGLTASGTGAMDATVSNLLSRNDKVLVINGGSFGSRFSQLCDQYQIPHEDYIIPFLHSFQKSEFEEYSGQGYTALLVNACETSTGQKYDLNYLGDFCVRNNILLIVDAVSSYLADPIDMEKMHIDALLTASQKALALAPGVSLIAITQHAYRRLGQGSSCFYFDFKRYITNQLRGQPPFTSAVGTMLSLHQRLESIRMKGIDAVNAEHAARANYFRKLLKDLPLVIPSFQLSNCCTPVLFPKENASEVYENLKNKHSIYLTPSGGDWKDKQLRIGHLGNLVLNDYDFLIQKLREELVDL